jgi:hypothetical protein
MVDKKLEREERKNPNHGNNEAVQIIIRRSDEQIRKDRNDILSLMGRGLTVLDIRDWLEKNRDYTLSYSSVQTEVTEIRKAMRESASIQKRDFLLAELNRLNELEREFWSEFQRSKLPYKEDTFEETADTVEVVGRKKNSPIGDSQNRERTSDDFSPSKKEVLAKKTRTLHKEIERSGNLDALRGIFDVIAMRVKLLHLDSPNIWEEIEEWTEDAKREGVTNPGAMFNEIVEHYVVQLRSGELSLDDEKKAIE